MTISYACLLIAVLLPYVWVVCAKAGIKIDGEPRGYNNHAPRAQQEQLQGWRRRAVWAHNNAFEALPGFIAAVLVAAHAGVAVGRINVAALLFVLVRVLHGIFYLADQAMLRSLSWLIGIGAVAYLFAQALMH
ncbi:MAPEG family protein [Chitinimonas sp.]|uniref:MAPEG family protein n=1 Tax=Chitinimonas sp. TaxID=1934313 RepID=UPI0035B1B567